MSVTYSRTCPTRACSSLNASTETCATRRSHAVIWTCRQLRPEASSADCTQYGSGTPAHDLEAIEPQIALEAALRAGRYRHIASEPYMFLPSPKCACFARERATHLASRRSAEAIAARYCSADAAPEAAEAEGILRSNKGGVAKVLIYLSESAARLASAGKRQRIPASASWVFARGLPSCGEGWGCFFREELCMTAITKAPAMDPADARRNTPEPSPPLPRRVFEHALIWPSSLRRGWWIAQALHSRLSALSERAGAEVERMLEHMVTLPAGASDAPQQAPLVRGGNLTISMHVRRGDACQSGQRDSSARIARGVRRCFTLDDYVLGARKLRDVYQAEHVAIHLATDSAQVERDLRRHRDFEWRFLRINRSQVGGPENANVGRRGTGLDNIEDRARRASEPNNALLVHSLLAELRFLATGHAFVGTARSFVGTAVLLLMWARLGALPPAISLEGYPIHFMLHIRGQFWLNQSSGFTVFPSDLDAMRYVRGFFLRRDAQRAAMTQLRGTSKRRPPQVQVARSTKAGT